MGQIRCYSLGSPNPTCFPYIHTAAAGNVNLKIKGSLSQVGAVIEERRGTPASSPHHFQKLKQSHQGVIYTTLESVYSEYSAHHAKLTPCQGPFHLLKMSLGGRAGAPPPHAAVPGWEGFFLIFKMTFPAAAVRLQGTQVGVGEPRPSLLKKNVMPSLVHSCVVHGSFLWCQYLFPSEWSSCILSDLWAYHASSPAVTHTWLSLPTPPFSFNVLLTQPCWR